MIALIASVGPNLELGLNNQLIYHSKEDMAFFKSMTTGHKVVMGLNTFKSIGKPLPNRENFVVTHHGEGLPEEVTQVTDLEGFLDSASSDLIETVFVIGGASIYKQAIDHAEYIYLTEFDESKEADAFFPQFNPAFYKKTKVQSIPGGTIYQYEFHPWKIKPNYVLV